MFRTRRYCVSRERLCGFVLRRGLPGRPGLAGACRGRCGLGPRLPGRSCRNETFQHTRVPSCHRVNRLEPLVRPVAGGSSHTSDTTQNTLVFRPGCEAVTRWLRAGTATRGPGGGCRWVACGSRSRSDAGTRALEVAGVARPLRAPAPARRAEAQVTGVGPRLPELPSRSRKHRNNDDTTKADGSGTSADRTAMRADPGLTPRGRAPQRPEASPPEPRQVREELGDRATVLPTLSISP